MYVLGIETSCDETAAAVVSSGTKVLSSVVSSSLKFHKKYGGVIPEIAFRMQLETIAAVVDSALKEASLARKEIGLLSVTNGPGLAGSLFVGVSFAKAVSLALGVPLVAVNHLHAHIYAGLLGPHRRFAFPFMALVVSGGHTSLFLVRDFDDVRSVGSTQDDACGEAFDKVAKLLGLGYPGGPLIEKEARLGDPSAIRFKCSDTAGPLDFSFSGIKTAVMYYLKARHRAAVGSSLARDIAASFQEAVTGVLARKALAACARYRVGTLVVGGGVAANGRLRERLGTEGARAGVRIQFPSPELCMDNAAMVAGLGYRLFKKGHRSGINLTTEV